MAKRLMFITHRLDNTGAPLVLMDAIMACQRNGFEIHVCSLEDGVLRKKLVSAGISLTIADNFLDDISLWQETFRKYDAVIANTLLCLEAIYVLNAIGVPTIWWIHEHELWFQHYQSVLPKAYDLRPNIRVYGVSPITNLFIEEYCGYETGLLPFGVVDRLKEFCEDPKAQESEQKVRFLCPATYSEVKGQDIFCEVISGLSTQVREKCEFVFCGAPIETAREYYEKIKNFERSFPQVKVYESLPHDRVLQMVSEGDFVVVPSRLEPFSATAVEAMMMERIPIISDACGISCWIENGENGFIFENTDSTALAGLLEKAVLLRAENEADYRLIAGEARKTYLEFFSMESFEKNFMNELVMAMEGTY